MRTVTVTGHGTHPAVPDTAVLRVGVAVREPSLAEAFHAAAELARRVRSVAGDHTDARRIASSGVQVWSQHDETGRRSGFEARHSFTIGCDDLPTASTLLEALVAAVGDQLTVDDVSLQVGDETAARVAAREAAWADARARAEQLAALAAANLGAVQQVSESVGGHGPGPGVLFARAASADMGLSPGETAVSAALEVTWELV